MEISKNGRVPCGSFTARKGREQMPDIEINRDWCKGCYICVDVCPRKVLEIDQTTFQKGRHPVLVARLEDCTVCRQCELLCPDLAIIVSNGTKQKMG